VGKTGAEEKKITESFFPSMKFQNGIFWMVDWWVLLAHSSSFSPESQSR
jgi:hypothetical protein